MGVGENFGEAFAKAQLSAGTPLPDRGTVFISVNDRQKSEAVQIGRRLADLGFRSGGYTRNRRGNGSRGSALQDGVQSK